MRTCRCGRQLDPFGHHRAACSVAGVLGLRVWEPESVGRQERGSRRTFLFETWICSHRMCIRLEIVAEGLPLFGGAQLAVDTTLVSAHHCDGIARPRAAHVDGVALTEARRRKERAYPELVGPRSRAELVVLAGEVGERWSAETTMFLRLLAAAHARWESELLRTSLAHALGRHAGVCRSTGFRRIIVGTPDVDCSFPMVGAMEIRLCSQMCCQISATLV